MKIRYKKGMANLSGMVAGTTPSQPTASNDLGAIQAPDRPMRPALPPTAPLSTATTSRHYLRQEP